MKINVEELNLQICDLLDSNINEKSKEGLHNLLGEIRDLLEEQKKLDIKEDIVSSLDGQRTLREGIKLHIIDGINSLREQTPEIKQAEHNFFEIANHLSIDVN